MIEFSISITPVPKGRPRASVINGRARLYTPPQTSQYERRVRAAAEAQMVGLEPLQGALRVRVHCLLPIPTFARSKAKRAAAVTGQAWPTAARSGDVDNLAKAVLDACNGVLWVDDCQIVDLRVTKRFGLEPGVEVSVEGVE